MSTPLLENILNQAEALRTVSEFHLGGGRAALLRAAGVLQSKKRVILSGMGASGFACVPFQYALARRGIDAATIESAELLYFLASNVNRDMALVLVSRSGESVEITKLFSEARRRGAAVVGLTNVPGSALASGADEAIVMHSPPDQFVAIQSYTATLATFALLDAAISGELARAQAELETAAETLSNWIPACVSESNEWRSFLETDSPLYLLARGPALGSVQEAVLLLHETAKMPAVGTSCAQFRHGLVEVVDDKFRCLIIGTQSATLDLDAALAQDLVRMGGQVRWIGRRVSGAELEPLCPWPEPLPERFAPIAEIIPIQIAAYRQAELRGIAPGEFRWAPLVTTSEAGFAR